MIHINAKIWGEVQGIGLRYMAKVKAGKFDIKGFIRNDPDNTVYMEIEGKKEAVEGFLNWLQRDFKQAKITRFESEKGIVENFKNFIAK
ncbi:MAG: acylphosphatase [Candidatus Zambryskibacteria bacterium]|nr:acylphosphatase [Candidatus Zambryskibacteria bacterium]